MGRKGDEWVLPEIRKLPLPLSWRALIAKLRHYFWNGAASTAAVSTWKCWSLHFFGSCLSATLTVENRRTFCFAFAFWIPTRASHFQDLSGNQPRESGSVIISTPHFPPSKEKGLEGQEANCIPTDCIWPSALYLSPLNIKEQGGSSGR